MLAKEVDSDASSPNVWGSFRGNVIRLASGAVIAQLILLSATPLLSRLFSPDTFGIAALFSAVTGIISVVGCLRYEYAIVLPESEGDARRLLFASLAISVGVAVISTVVVFSLGPLLLTRFNMAELQPFLWLIPISILAQSLIQALNFWNTRKIAFFKVATGKIIQAAVTTFLALGLGMAGHVTASSMVGSNVAGFACAAFVLFFVSLSAKGRQTEQGSGLDSAPLSLLRRYRKFATHSTGPALLNAISWQLPALLLGFFFSSGVVGLYALTMKVVQTPIGLIHQTISQVFYREVAMARTDCTLDTLVESLFSALSKAALLPCLLLLMSGRILFEFVFGPAWDQAGLYVQILSPWVFIWFITSPLSTIYLALERQEEEIRVQGTIFTARCLSLLVGGYIGDPVMAIILFAISGVLTYGYLFFVICRCAKLNALATAAKILPSFGTSLMCATPTAVCLAIGMPNTIIITVVFCTAIAHGILFFRCIRVSSVFTQKNK